MAIVIASLHQSTSLVPSLRSTSAIALASAGLPGEKASDPSTCSVSTLQVFVKRWPHRLVPVAAALRPLRGFWKIQT